MSTNQNENECQQDINSNTNHSSQTLKFLKDKTFAESFRKPSSDTIQNRQNFCLNLTSTEYSVMRVYIDAASSKQIKLYYTKFTPKHKIGQICIVHGYGENTDDYLKMSQYFTKSGYVIHMADLRGFGYSGGSRVNEPTLKVMKDIETLLRTCCERDLPTFLIAHGLGSLFLSALLQQNRELPISGVINITPLLNFVSNNRSFTFQRFMLKLLPTIFSNILVHNMINPTALTKNGYAIRNKINSNFWQNFITLRMADEYQQVGQKVRDQGYKYCYPTLFICGGKDLIQDLKSLKSYFSSLNSQDKQMIIFRQGYHNIHTDNQADEMMKRMLQWMNQRIKQTKWKQISALKLNTIFKIKYFWRKTCTIIIIILFIFKFTKQVLKRIKK